MRPKIRCDGYCAKFFGLGEELNRLEVRVALNLVGLRWRSAGGIKDPHQTCSISDIEPEKSWTKIKVLKPKPADPKPVNIHSKPDPLPLL
jgi:hypothetical protein